MKIFLLLVIVILFILRVKGTPRMLSKKRYTKNIKETFRKIENDYKNQSEENIKIARYISLIVGILFQVIMAIVYINIGAAINIRYFTLLTLIQLLTVVYTGVNQVNIDVFNPDSGRRTFKRWYFLFNVILDYIYYPLAFYLLIK